VHSLLKLAIQSVEHFIETCKPLPCPYPLLDNLKQNAGTFVSIRTQDSLRGCLRNAICAANEDPRFDPIEKRELPFLIFSVDVLTPPKKNRDLKEHNIKSANQQLKVCLKKNAASK
jgi:AMMECR1 domain-containing protein